MPSASYDTYAPALYGMLLRIVADKQLAGRLLQKIFVAHSCSEMGEFPTFIQLVRCMMRILQEENLVTSAEARHLFCGVPLM